MQQRGRAGSENATETSPTTGQRQGAQAPAGQTQSGQTQSGQAQSGQAPQSSGSVTLNEQQRTRISTAISEQRVQPLTRPNFSVSVGTTVPRSVRLHPLPASIAAVVPQYRGYSYVVVEDRIVIIEPRTKKIVTVIDKSGGRAATTGTSRTRMQLSEAQRTRIRQTVSSEKSAQPAPSVNVTVGETVPSSIELYSFPETIYAEVPVVREYRYFMRDDEVVVVDPTELRVVEIIR